MPLEYTRRKSNFSSDNDCTDTNELLTATLFKISGGKKSTDIMLKTVSRKDHGNDSHPCPHQIKRRLLFPPPVDAVLALFLISSMFFLFVVRIERY